MTVRYRLRDHLHYLRFFLRNQRRQRIWRREFESAVRQQTYELPSATVLQLLPTEACNLRCAMCNQWGENGYLLQGLRPISHMAPDQLAKLMGEVSPTRTLISVHGGEPFAYKHTEVLLDLLAKRQFDVIFSTNGTLLEPWLEKLARIDNLMFLLSIDGDEATHDRIRGAGCFAKARNSLGKLFALRRSLGMPLPLVLMSLVVCEFNTQAIEPAYEAARDLGVFAINYNLRWFLTEDVGQAYEKHLHENFHLKSTGAWRGWISNHAADYTPATEALRRVLGKQRWRLKPPFVATMPKGLKGKDFDHYFADYANVFGNDSCFMPFYWARVHSNGDLIYCPGHPDIIAGNVFRDGFLPAFNSPASIQFRKHILTNRLPICNRCCGLYMTFPARGQEQRARRKLGLSHEVATHLG